jgi:cytochrome c oxidase assembly protein subunit 15
VLVVVVVRAGGLGSGTVPARYERTLRSSRAAAGLTFLILVLGALTANTPGAAVACQGFPWCKEVTVSGAPLYIQVTHRIIAFLLVGHLIGIFLGVRKRAETRAVRYAAGAALGIVILQILVGAAMVDMHLPPPLRSLHQAVGTALWISVVALAALAAGTRGLTDIEQIVYESPSRGEFATPEGVAT